MKKNKKHISVDWWDSITKKQQNAIKESVKEADTGQVISHSEMVKKYSKWLQKSNKTN